MAIILTSFNRSKEIDGLKFSISRFQPKGFQLPELNFLAAVDRDGKKMLLRNYIDPIRGYEKALRDAYKERWDRIKKWLDELSSAKDIVLCCWCPYSQATKEQIQVFGYFACHSGLIGLMIEKHRPDIKIFLDQDRHEKLVPEWKPKSAEPLHRPPSFCDITMNDSV